MCACHHLHLADTPLQELHYTCGVFWLQAPCPNILFSWKNKSWFCHSTWIPHEPCCLLCAVGLIRTDSLFCLQKIYELQKTTYIIARLDLWLCRKLVVIMIYKYTIAYLSHLPDSRPMWCWGSLNTNVSMCNSRAKLFSKLILGGNCKVSTYF